MTEEVDAKIPATLRKRGRPPKPGGPASARSRMAAVRKRQKTAKEQQVMLMDGMASAFGRLAASEYRRTKEVPWAYRDAMNLDDFRNVSENALRAWASYQKEFDADNEDAQKDVRDVEALMAWMARGPGKYGKY